MNKENWGWTGISKIRQKKEEKRRSTKTKEKHEKKGKQAKTNNKKKI